MKKSPQPFAQGKDAWKSTLVKNEQSRGMVGRSSQNKVDKEAMSMLKKAFKK